MTAPLVPPEVDLRGLPFMPLDTVRLLDSDLFALTTGDEFKAALALWCKAWQQVPAASLPNDDRVLAHLSGAMSRWKKVKAAAMRGFVLCDDGRWYHPVIAEKAAEAWKRRAEFEAENGNRNERQQRWRKRVKALCEEIRKLGITPPPGASLETLERLLGDATQASTVDATSTVGRLVREGQRSDSEVQNRDSGVDVGPVAEPTPKLSTGPNVAAGKIATSTPKVNGVGQRWNDPAYVAASAATLGIPRHQGEDDDAFKDRVYVAAQEKRREARA